MKRGRSISDHVRRKALAYWFDGMPGPEIGRRLGVSRNYAHNVARKLGYLSPHKLRRARLWDRAAAVGTSQ